jgi:CxxC motif-containing protein
MEKKIICITCPKGCIVTVNGDPEKGTIDSLEGNECRRGDTYARNEFIHPVRILTSSVKTEGVAAPLMAVRTDAPIPKELLFAGMEEIKKITVKAPVAVGDVLVENFLGTGVNLVAAGSIE